MFCSLCCICWKQKFRSFERQGLWNYYLLNPKYHAHQRVLASVVYKFFDNETGSGVTATSKAGANLNEVLAQNLHKPVIKKFKKEKSMQG